MIKKKSEPLIQNLETEETKQPAKIIPLAFQHV